MNDEIACDTDNPEEFITEEEQQPLESPFVRRGKKAVLVMAILSLIMGFSFKFVPCQECRTIFGTRQYQVTETGSVTPQPRWFCSDCVEDFRRGK